MPFSSSNLPGDDGVTGTCVYYDNQKFGRDGHWFTEVDLANSGRGYIWVQRRWQGAAHWCDVSGTLYTIAFGSLKCPLYGIG